MQLKAALLGAFCVAAARAQLPCDPEAATACPFDGGNALGECLRDPSKHDAKTTIGADCQAFLDLHGACGVRPAHRRCPQTPPRLASLTPPPPDKCDENLNKNPCEGTAYGPDALLCLTQWTRADDLTAECKAALPVKEPEKERVLDAEAERKRARRKRARAKAAKEVKEINDRNAASEKGFDEDL